MNNNFNNTKYNKKMMTLPLEVLGMDNYQRPTSQSKVNKIVKSFDPIGVGSILVSRRNHRYYVFDGLHRLAAFKKLGIGTIDCIVYEGMSYTDEANAFKYFNGDNKRATSLDVANARYEAGDPLVHAISDTVKSVGLEIDFKTTNARGTIQAYNALEGVYKKKGSLTLKDTLSYIKNVFSDNLVSLYSSENLKGFSSFFEKYKDHENFKEEVLTKWLKQMDYSGFRTEVEKMKKVWQLTGEDAVVASLLKVHNDHRNTGNRIK